MLFIFINKLCHPKMGIQYRNLVKVLGDCLLEFGHWGNPCWRTPQSSYHLWYGPQKRRKWGLAIEEFKEGNTDVGRGMKESKWRLWMVFFAVRCNGLNEDEAFLWVLRRIWRLESTSHSKVKCLYRARVSWYGKLSLSKLNYLIENMTKIALEMIFSDTLSLSIIHFLSELLSIYF